MSKKLSDKEIDEIFKDLRIPLDNDFPMDNFQVWEIPPLKKGIRLYTESY